MDFDIKATLSCLEHFSTEGMWEGGNLENGQKEIFERGELTFSWESLCDSKTTKRVLIYVF